MLERRRPHTSCLQQVAVLSKKRSENGWHPARSRTHQEGQARATTPGWSVPCCRDLRPCAGRHHGTNIPSEAHTHIITTIFTTEHGGARLGTRRPSNNIDGPRRPLCPLSTSRPARDKAMISLQDGSAPERLTNENVTASRPHCPWPGRRRLLRHNHWPTSHSYRLNPSPLQVSQLLDSTSHSHNNHHLYNTNVPAEYLP